MHLVAVGVLPYSVYKSAISFRSTLSIFIFRKKALAIYNCTMVAPKIKGFSCSLYYLYNLSDHSHGIWQLYPSV